MEPVTTNLPTRYDMVFERLVELNADLKTVNEPESVNLLPATEFSGLSETLRNLGKLQSKADDLARRFQYRMFVCLNTAFVLVLLAGLSFIAYADIFSDERMIYAYLSLVAMILVIFLWERKSGWRRKYLDYRVLAEALRVQFYWSLAGLTSSEQYRYCHDSFHERRDLELGWIRNVMRFSGQQIDASPIKDEHSLD